MSDPFLMPNLCLCGVQAYAKPIHSHLSCFYHSKCYACFCWNHSTTRESIVEATVLSISQPQLVNCQFITEKFIIVEYICSKKIWWNVKFDSVFITFVLKYNGASYTLQMLWVHFDSSNHFTVLNCSNFHLVSSLYSVILLPILEKGINLGVAAASRCCGFKTILMLISFQQNYWIDTFPQKRSQKQHYHCMGMSMEIL